MMSATTLGGRYVLGEMLGHGATAIVVRARDLKLDRDVAVKILAENLAAERATCERFVREARVAARWSHPNLVQVFDVGEEDGRPFMVMEHIDGPNLAQDLRARGSFRVSEVLEIGRSVASGLVHIHEAGLIHRDIKPANLLRGPDGSVKMTDFGIALDPSLTSLTEVGAIMGTVAYLAPERVSGAPSSPAEDIYALGVCLYEMLNGRPPYEATTLPELLAMMRSHTVPPLGPQVPRQAAEVIERCIAMNPAARPSSAAELLEALSDGPAQTIAESSTPARPAMTAPGTDVLEVPDAETVRFQTEREVTPGRVTATFGPPRVRRRVQAMVALAAAALLVVAGLISAITPDGNNGDRDRAPVSDSTATPRPTPSAGPLSSGDAEEAARELADWLRSGPSR